MVRAAPTSACRIAGRRCLGRCQRGQAEVHLEVRPAAQWTGALKGHAFFAYAANYLIDLDHAVIVDVDASRERVAADSVYGSAEMLNWLVHEQGIEPHIPVFDKSQRSDGTFSRDEFAYDHKRDCYICPAGKELRQRQNLPNAAPFRR